MRSLLSSIHDSVARYARAPGIDRRAALTFIDGLAPGPEWDVDLALLSAQITPTVITSSVLSADACDLPVLTAISRREWATWMMDTIDTIGSPADVTQVSGAEQLLAATGRGARSLISAAQVAVIAPRIAGQYEPGIFDVPHAGQLAVLPENIHSIATRMNVDVHVFGMWVAAHEICHGVQFAAAPHLIDELRAVLAGMRASDEDWLRELRPKLELLKARMTLLEGHADWTMDRAGHALELPVDDLRAAQQRSRAQMGVGMRLVGLLLSGKMRQYRVGRAFCDDVERHAGADALALAFVEGNAPTCDELACPQRWLTRVRA